MAVKRSAPAAARNRDPILAVLRRYLPSSGLVLEIASGTGEHATYFAEALPHLVFQPSDPDPAARASIDAWQASAGLQNVRSALALDAANSDWPIDTADAIVCINMVHISPWKVTEGLISGAARRLPKGGLLFLYGPYRRDGVPTAPSNEAFDADLRDRNPQWGLRQLEDVIALAADAGLDHAETVEMPANNVSVLFRRR